MSFSNDVIHPWRLERRGHMNSLNDWVEGQPKKSFRLQSVLGVMGMLSNVLCKNVVSEKYWIKRAALFTPKLFFAASLGLTIKTFWQWRHLFDQIFYERLAFSYTPSISPLYEPIQLRSADGNLLAELKYQEHLPILWFAPTVTNPAERGRIEGLLLGDYILDICRLGIQPILTYLELEKGSKGQKRLQKCMDHLFIPSSVQLEFDGICAGFKDRMARDRRTCDVNPENFIKTAHILGDVFKAVGTNFACSTMASFNERNELVIGRNFDWPSMGYIGKRLLIRQYTVEAKTISMLTFPGYVGAITAWNSDGFVVILNELGRVSQGKGMPYSLITKRLIEECGTVEEAKRLIQQIQQKTPCASSVTMFIADENHAAMVQFYPEDDQNYVIRDLEPNKTLMVTNHFENHEGSVVEKSICEPKSVKRALLMKKAYLDCSSKTSLNVIETALKAAGVPSTIGVFISNQATKEKKIVFENFCAHRLLDKVNIMAKL